MIKGFFTFNDEFLVGEARNSYCRIGTLHHLLLVIPISLSFRFPLICVERF